MGAIIGISKEDNYISIPDQSRNSGLYILGKPRMGKSWLIVNLILQNIEKEQGIFFLDPHGDAITDLIRHDPSPIVNNYLLFDPEDKKYSFGINLFECSDIEDPKARVDTFARAKGVFDKLWKSTFEEKPWLQLILQNTIYAFIENQGYTLAEFPLFFRDSSFRAFICNNIKYNITVRDYWLKTFAAKSKRDQDTQMEAAQTRAEIMLGHPYVLDIVGQAETTIPFDRLINSSTVILVKLSASLPYESKKIIGTILVSELLHAVRNRPANSQNFYIYIDEFQNFASFEDFAVLITQAPKHNICTTIAHHDRYGQLLEDPGILGATSAIANKVLFQLTARDAPELAVELAEKPPTQIKKEPELVLSHEPVADLLRREHTNPKIQKFVTDLLLPWNENLKRLRDAIYGEQITRTAALDQANIYRDEANLYQVSSRIEGARNRLDINYDYVRGGLISGKLALEQMTQVHERISRHTRDIESMTKSLIDQEERMRILNRYFYGFMSAEYEARKGNEQFAQFLVKVVGDGLVSAEQTPLLHFWILLEYGDLESMRVVPEIIAKRYYMNELETIYVQQQLEYYKEKQKDRSEHYDEWLKEDAISLKRGYEIYITSGHYGKQEEHQVNIRTPTLPARILSIGEQTKLWSFGSGELPRTALLQLYNLVYACEELCKLENHIRVPSGQYIEVETPLRTEADMVGEKVREITELPKYTAYARVQ